MRQAVQLCSCRNSSASLASISPVTISPRGWGNTCSVPISPRRSRRDERFAVARPASGQFALRKFGALIEEVRFARDSPLERTRFELAVPLRQILSDELMQASRSFSSNGLLR
jgi:hypothetical protein